MINRTTTLELFQENMKFSSGHFILLSETEREPYHGHNFRVYLAITTAVGKSGISFDFRLYKRKVCELCSHLDHSFLIPSQSNFLKIKENGDQYEVCFNQEKLVFLKKDVTLLPIRNISVEELSYWFITNLTEDTQTLAKHEVSKLVVKVSSDNTQSGSACWEVARAC